MKNWRITWSNVEEQGIQYPCSVVGLQVLQMFLSLAQTDRFIIQLWLLTSRWQEHGDDAVKSQAELFAH